MNAFSVSLKPKRLSKRDTRISFCYNYERFWIFLQVKIPIEILASKWCQSI